MRNKKFIVVLIVLLSIGFASIATNLIINNTSSIGKNIEDFDVIFTKAILDGVDISDKISSDGKTITYETNVLRTLNDTSKLEYEITNNSKNYDAKIDVDTTINLPTSDYFTIDTSDKPERVLAGSQEKGSILVTLNRVSVDDQSIEFTYKLNATAEERNTIGEVSNSYYGTVFDAEDEPVTNSAVVLFTAENPEANTANNILTSTDENGTFYVNNLPSGTTDLCVSCTKTADEIGNASKSQVVSDGDCTISGSITISPDDTDPNPNIETDDGLILENDLTAVQVVMKKANTASATYYNGGKKKQAFVVNHDETELIPKKQTDYRYVGYDGKWCDYDNGAFANTINTDGTCPKAYLVTETTTETNSNTGETKTSSYSVYGNKCPDDYTYSYKETTRVYKYTCETLESKVVESEGPNNWVYFNCKDYTDTATCEKWRIIGAIPDEDDNYRLKLIREKQEGPYKPYINQSYSYSWFNSNVSRYINRTINQKTKDFYIENDATFYSEIAMYSVGYNVDYIYSNERSTNTSYLLNPFNNFGALMNLSDYLYTFSGINNRIIDRTIWSSYLTDDYNGYKNSWLMKSKEEYTLTRNEAGFYEYIGNGKVSSDTSEKMMRPVVYLQSPIKFNVSKGNGSKEKPYVIVPISDTKTTTVLPSTSGAVETLIAKANSESENNYFGDTAKQGEMFVFKHDKTKMIDKEQTSYRYIGGRYCSYDDGKVVSQATRFNNKVQECYPIYKTVDDEERVEYSASSTSGSTELSGKLVGGANNWIYFNCSDYSDVSSCEKWRIIGAIPDENNVYRLKLIRNNHVDLGYDSKIGNTIYFSGSSYIFEESNDWSSSTVRYKVNTEVNDISKDKYIEEATWYTGGSTIEKPDSAPTMYTEERSGKTCENQGVCEYQVRESKYKDKVGIMNVSDYLYTFSNAYKYPTYSNKFGFETPSSMLTSNWLAGESYGDTKWEWFINPYLGGRGDYDAYDIYGTNGVYHYQMKGGPHYTRPVVYLKHDIEFSGGTGTETDPYVIKALS